MDKLKKYEDRQRKFIEKHGENMSEFYTKACGKAERNLAILEMYGSGEGMGKIAKTYDLSRERVRGIIQRFARSYVKAYREVYERR